ncbi:MAG: hypothetical protein ACFFEK_13605 [Candidatus Thorarchaeota archaeon]
MSEIPMADSGMAAGARPQEVQIAAWLVLLESIVGLIIGVFEYWYWENDLSLIGAILALIGFWVYTLILRQDYGGWMIAVIFNILALVLYAIGENWGGVILSLICFLYLLNPPTRIHFEPK